MRLLTIFSKKPHYTNFCIPEMKSLFRLFGVDWKTLFQHELGNASLALDSALINKRFFKSFPFVEVEVPDTAILSPLLERSILIKAFVHVIAEGKDYEELMGNLSKNMPAIESYLSKSERLCFKIKSHQRSISFEDQMKIIDRFGKLCFSGKVDLKNPDTVLYVVENHTYSEEPVPREKTLVRVYFGVQIAKRRKWNKTDQGRFELVERCYLGPTTTDNGLAFLMANQGLITEGDYVFDPFVGTGGLIIPPTTYGAICFGSDIDPRVLQGTAVGRSNGKSKYMKEHKDMKMDIWANFKQYNLRFPEIMRIDALSNQMNTNPIFEAIICDPPYGVRAGAKKTGLKEKPKNEEAYKRYEEKKMKDQDFQLPIGKTANIEEMVLAIFTLAQRLLKKGGRLIFLFPIERDHEKEEFFEKKGEMIDYFFGMIPKHENYQLIDYSENVMTSLRSRLLLTYERLS